MRINKNNVWEVANMSLISAMLKTYKGSNLGRAEIMRLQNKRLKKLVKYARNNSLYFKELYKDIK